jgi:septal ring factor EnvC (AmiA/AmiB activator)
MAKTTKNKVKKSWWSRIMYILTGKWLERGFFRHNMGVFLILILLLVGLIWKNYNYKDINRQIKKTEEQINRITDDKKKVDKKLELIKGRKSEIERLLREKGIDIKESTEQPIYIHLTTDKEDGK